MANATSKDWDGTNPISKSKPGWEQRAVEGIAAAEGYKATKEKVIRSNWQWWMLVRRAARQRDISLQSYVRRAVSAFLVRDLGMAWEEVVSLCPAVIPFDQYSAQGRAARAEIRRSVTRGDGSHDDGLGHGDWVV